jgi:photosystem II stability/assembly factor-like uncharacterized protein
MYRSILIFCILIILQTGTLMSQWTEVGLASDRVLSLAVGSNGYIYAGTYMNGLYRSTDNGSTWIQVLGPSSVYEVFSITFDLSGNLLVGTYKAGLYRSTNNGDSWTLLSSSTGPNNLPVDDILAVAVPPSGTIFASDYGEIYKSTDNGSTWSNSKNSTGGSNGGFWTIAYGSSRVYISGSNDWFYHSTNDGSTWNWMGSSSGLTKAPLSLAVNSSGIIFAGTSGGGIYKSNDLGLNWTAANHNLTTSYINTVAIDSAGLIYAGTSSNGIYVSTDTGANWSEWNNGLTNLDIRSIAFDHLGNVYAGAYKTSGAGGVWRSRAFPVEVKNETGILPNTFSLLQNYPNPFNPSTTIEFTLAEKSKVTLKVIDLLGRTLITLVDGEMPNDVRHRVTFDGSRFTSGVYFYRMNVQPDGQARAFTQTKKFMLLK